MASSNEQRESQGETLGRDGGGSRVPLQAAIHTSLPLFSVGRRRTAQQKQEGDKKDPHDWPHTKRLLAYLKGTKPLSMQCCGQAKLAMLLAMMPEKASFSPGAMLRLSLKVRGQVPSTLKQQMDSLSGWQGANTNGAYSGEGFGGGNDEGSGLREFVRKYKDEDDDWCCALKALLKTGSSGVMMCVFFGKTNPNTGMPLGHWAVLVGVDCSSKTECVLTFVDSTNSGNIFTVRVSKSLSSMKPPGLSGFRGTATNLSGKGTSASATVTSVYIEKKS